MEIASGMVVWTPDGDRLGRVAEVHEGVFVVAGGRLHRFVARSSDVRQVFEGRLILASRRSLH